MTRFDSAPPSGRAVPVDLDTMLRLILTSRVYDVAHRDAARARRRGCRGGSATQVLLKREDLQPIFSFKLRGAYNRIAHLSDDGARRAGVIAASAGNHAQGVALSAQRLGIRALIVMPQTTPEIKVRGGARPGRRGRAARRRLRRARNEHARGAGRASAA